MKHSLKGLSLLHRVTLLSALLLPLALVCCAAAPGSTAPVVRIGLVAPFEGRHRDIGYDVIYAARLAAREVNAGGGVEGYRVELVALDDSGRSERAELAAGSLAIDPMVVAAMGHWLDETTEAARPIYAKASLPFLEMGPLPSQPTDLPATFAEDYQEVAPFGERPGPYAPAAYAACRRLIDGIQQAIAADGRPTRSGVANALFP